MFHLLTDLGQGQYSRAFITWLKCVEAATDYIKYKDYLGVSEELQWENIAL